MVRQAILGDVQKRPGLLDPELAAELKELSTPEDPWQIYSGKTMCTTDFYEGKHFSCCPRSDIFSLWDLHRHSKDVICVT